MTEEEEINKVIGQTLMRVTMPLSNWAIAFMGFQGAAEAVREKSLKLRDEGKLKECVQSAEAYNKTMWLHHELNVQLEEISAKVTELVQSGEISVEQATHYETSFDLTYARWKALIKGYQAYSLSFFRNAKSEFEHLPSLAFDSTETLMVEQVNKMTIELLVDYMKYADDGKPGDEDVSGVQPTNLDGNNQTKESMYAGLGDAAPMDYTGEGVRELDDSEIIDRMSESMGDYDELYDMVFNFIGFYNQNPTGPVTRVYVGKLAEAVKYGEGADNNEENEA